MPGSAPGAYDDHGTLPHYPPAADRRAAALDQFATPERGGVDFADVTDTLEREGPAKFDKSRPELSARGSRGRT
ncbi:hypothetical protein ACGFZQ_34415 [Streptomyces sp. NPDC048254]|uniref:hypothetical protein n=1 Tax=Streptomyces sp. NPDC048254 TaxID=3365525 RepID=UPI00371F3470